MATEIFILAMALLFLVMSIFLFNGKGKWLISGYNTASKKEREKYDEKKLCKGAGFISAVCSVMLCAMAYMGYRVESGAVSEDAMQPFGLIFTAVVLASVVAALIYMNTKARK